MRNVYFRILTYIFINSVQYIINSSTKTFSLNKDLPEILMPGKSGVINLTFRFQMKPFEII